MRILGLRHGGNQRPDLILGVPIYLHTGDKRQFLNPAAFALPAAGKSARWGAAAYATQHQNVDLLGQ